MESGRNNGDLAGRALRALTGWQRAVAYCHASCTATPAVASGIACRSSRRQQRCAAPLAALCCRCLTLALFPYPCLALSGVRAAAPGGRCGIWSCASCWSRCLPRARWPWRGLARCRGAVLQVMLHNPAAEPGLFGVSSGAGLAAMAAMAVASSASICQSQVVAGGLGGALVVTTLLIRLGTPGTARLRAAAAVRGRHRYPTQCGCHDLADVFRRRFASCGIHVLDDGQPAYGSQQLAWRWLVLPSPRLVSAGRGGHCNNCRRGTQACLYGLNGQHAGTPVPAVCLLTGRRSPCAASSARSAPGA